MAPKRLLAVATTIWLACCIAGTAPERFKARLATVPMDASMRSTVAGTGTASATLSNHHLTVAGTFEGLRSPATTAQLHRGRITGVRGPAVFDLTATPATRGAIAGAFDLTADQLDDLRQGEFYIQIDSEKAPEGNLWGWLLK